MSISLDCRWSLCVRFLNSNLVKCIFLPIFTISLYVYTYRTNFPFYLDTLPYKRSFVIRIFVTVIEMKVPLQIHFTLEIRRHLKSWISFPYFPLFMNHECDICWSWHAFVKYSNFCRYTYSVYTHFKWNAHKYKFCHLFCVSAQSAFVRNFIGYFLKLKLKVTMCCKSSYSNCHKLLIRKLTWNIFWQNCRHHGCVYNCRN